jgi:transaldolase/glucose-6-phosphate isomerase
VLLMGMGGSSLCPDVMKKTFGRQRGFPELHVLDSTDPAQVSAYEKRLNLERTLFIVSSKTGLDARAERPSSSISMTAS